MRPNYSCAVKRTLIPTLLVLFCLGAFPCSQFIPGVFPIAMQKVSGDVQGSLRPQQSKLGERPAISGAHIELRTRVDGSYVEKVTDESPYKAMMLRKYKGAITAFHCGTLIATTETGSSGHFELLKPANGKYCLNVVLNDGTLNDGCLRADPICAARREKVVQEVPVDVGDTGAHGLVIDLSPLQSDCTGGGTLVRN